MKPEPGGYSLLISSMTFFDYIWDVWIAKRNSNNKSKKVSPHTLRCKQKSISCPDCKKWLFARKINTFYGIHVYVNKKEIILAKLDIGTIDHEYPIKF